VYFTAKRVFHSVGVTVTVISLRVRTWARA